MDCIRVLSWNRDILIFGTKRVRSVLSQKHPETLILTFDWHPDFFSHTLSGEAHIGITHEAKYGSLEFKRTLMQVVCKRPCDPTALTFP